MLCRQAGTQSTELHQPGPVFILIHVFKWVFKLMLTSHVSNLRSLISPQSYAHLTLSAVGSFLLGIGSIFTKYSSEHLPSEEPQVVFQSPELCRSAAVVTCASRERKAPALLNEGLKPCVRRRALVELKAFGSPGVHMKKFVPVSG